MLLRQQPRERPYHQEWHHLAAVIFQIWKNEESKERQQKTHAFLFNIVPSFKIEIKYLHVTLCL